MRGELEGVLRCFVPEWTGLGSVSSLSPLSLSSQAQSLADW